MVERTFVTFGVASSTRVFGARAHGIGDTLIPWPTTHFDYYPLTTQTFYISEGENVQVTDPLTGVTIEFTEVTESGTVRIAASDVGPDPPAGFRIEGQYCEISTIASYSGIILIGVPYDEDSLSGNEEDLKLERWDAEAEQWIELPGWVDTTADIVYGETVDLSTFASIGPSEPWIDWILILAIVSVVVVLIILGWKITKRNKK